MTVLETWIDEAVAVAMKSPCQSKRGVIICDEHSGLIASGFNHQPFPFICNGSDDCKRNCGKTAIHAEQSAILSANRSLRGCVLLHVKAKDNKPCASGPPSCLECSKLILESGIGYVLLLSDPHAQLLPGAEVIGKTTGWTSASTLGELDVRQYSAIHFHWLTAEYFHRISLVLPEKAVQP